MRDVDMADAGEVAVQLPVDPLLKPTSLNNIPIPMTQAEADLYSKLKKLQRDLEFLSLQEVALPFEWKRLTSRSTLKKNNAA